MYVFYRGLLIFNSIFAFKQIGSSKTNHCNSFIVTCQPQPSAECFVYVSIIIYGRIFVILKYTHLIILWLVDLLFLTIDSSCNPSIVFVTVYTGATDEPRGADTIPPPPSPHHSIYFSDNPTILQTAFLSGWKTFKMSGSPVHSSYRNAMKAKVVKAVPHELINFKENYNYLVYFDSKIHLNYNYTKTLICTWLEKDSNIALLTTKHRQHFQTVDDEFQEALKQTRYRMHGKRMKEYIFMREHENLMLQKKKNRISLVVDHPEAKI